ncbi:MAG: cellulase family glycosylhydrolase [Bacteroidetes bacterium]|nr:cellulase family glycosylhydrolase [Bacteroidota bacterium]
MHRYKFLLTIVVVLVLPIALVGQTVQRPQKGTQYEPVIVVLNENLNFSNPFDLIQNQVELHMLLPDNTRRTLSFFYDGQWNGRERWEARFTPKQAGLHRFSVIVHGVVRDTFSVLIAKNTRQKQGGITLSDRHGTFQYESGEAFRGIGLNVCWADDYEYYFRKMQQAGINVVRIWMCPWHLSFEWQETGLGRYNLETAKRLDTILTLAERYGIYIDLCFDYHGIAPKGLGFFREDRWRVNPYNVLNGGPCNDRIEWFTNTDAKRFQKQRYKYLVSRYGYSNALCTWEFLNEADLMAGHSKAINAWHIEMAEYVKSIDVHKRLVTSSSTRRYVEKLVDAFKSPAFDYIHFHDYNMHDVAAHCTYLHEATLEYYDKPVVMGEFGIEYRGGELTYKLDSLHVGLHNGIWAGFFNETPIIPMSWWWDSYIDKYDLWHEYNNLTRFAQFIDFNSKNLRFITLTAGYERAKPSEQVSCFVRALYFGTNCALWIKNDAYKWWLLSEGKEPAIVPSFVQPVPAMLPGTYTAHWYDPQTGSFSTTVDTVVVDSNGSAVVQVPPVKYDIACLLTKIR